MKIARRRLFGLVAAIAAVGTVKPSEVQGAPVKAYATGGWVQEPSLMIGESHAVTVGSISGLRALNETAWPVNSYTVAPTINTSAGHYVGDGQAERSLPVPPNAKMLMIAPGWDGTGWSDGEWGA